MTACILKFTESICVRQVSVPFVEKQIVCLFLPFPSLLQHSNNKSTFSYSAEFELIQETSCNQRMWADMSECWPLMYSLRDSNMFQITPPCTPVMPP